MQNLVANITALSNDADGAFIDQTRASAGFLTLNGALVSNGVAVFAQAQKIAVEGTGNNAAVTLTITGTDPDGTAISENRLLANNGTATSVLSYKTITSLYVDALLDGNIEGGPLSTNGCISRSLRVNGEQPDFKLGVFVDISGTLTYTAQYAYENPESAYSISYSASAQWLPVDGLSAASADAVSNIFYKVNAVRIIISAYTNGTAKLTVTQSY